MQIKSIHLFAGAGGGILCEWIALGQRPQIVAAVEIEPFCIRNLLLRQADGILPPFPIWDDIRTFPARDWRGKCDLLAGGFPCQDISAAGKGEGIDGERSGLWREFARCICEIRPRFVFVENSPMLTNRGLSRVLRDLAALGYDAEWLCLSAGECGAPHDRDRIWILARMQGADTELRRLQERRGTEAACGIRCGLPGISGVGTQGVQFKENEMVPDSHGLRKLQPERSVKDERGWTGDGYWWDSEPQLGRVAHGVANRVDRIRAIGNGQVPIVAARAFCELMARFDNV